MSAEPSGAGFSPVEGDTVRDARTGRVGVVMDRCGERFFLRPLGGGREWEADPRDIRAISRAEVLSARVAAVNTRHRRGDL